MEYSPRINQWFTISINILYINHISTIVNQWLTIIVPILTLHFGRPRILPKPALAPSRVPGTPNENFSEDLTLPTPPRRQAEAEKGGTYFSMGVTPIAVWIVDFMKNPKIKWMMTGGTSPQFLGNFHI